MSTPSGHGNSTPIADARTLAAELGRRVAARPESEGIAVPYLALLSAQAPVEDAFSPPPLPKAEVRDRLARGVPALARDMERGTQYAARNTYQEVPIGITYPIASVFLFQSCDLEVSLWTAL
jgi:hypothetical protein